jgi:hypothetical protein
MARYARLTDALYVVHTMADARTRRRRQRSSDGFRAFLRLITREVYLKEES